MLWSLSAAEDHGFDVDSEELQQWKDWSTNPIHFAGPDQQDDLDVPDTLASNIDTMNALLLAIGDNYQSDWRIRFAGALRANRQHDFSWKACGQLPAQKRPVEETTSVTTLWTLLALARERELPENYERSLVTVSEIEPVSTEWWVARLLLSAELQDPAVGEYRDNLLRLQRDDGGWGWLSDEDSDALATGMAMFALASVDIGKGLDQQLAAAAEFLHQTQESDGSWKVPGTKKAARNRPTQTSNYWGTAWAVIGLLSVRER